MSNAEQRAQKVAAYLLQIKAIKVNSENPFIWASGWKSPIYCDNRKVLSYPEIREYMTQCFVDEINESFEKPDVIAGVATGGIALGVLVADVLNLPFVYVRAKSKGHGLQNMVEGELKEGQKVLVVEDLISTGMSSLNAVDALREAKAEIIGMTAIFTYGFQIAKDNFTKSDVELKVLSNYKVLIEEAANLGYVSSGNTESLQEWREDPSNWSPS
ncbi:MAG: orotate phosphoribosyltransferase [Flavobacteriales bacterium]|nr:orotate phosphoribosyltransferase [Flavobacteriales bacterium]